MTFAESVERVVAEQDFGVPTARKTGRDKRWPYVPVVSYLGTRPVEQILGKAFATRAEAKAHAAAVIDARRADFARRLALPTHRALRESHGLPREIA